MGALMGGMLILTLAAFVLVTGVAAMAYRRRKTRTED